VLPPTGGRSVGLTRQLRTSETYLLKRRIIVTCTVIFNVLALNVCYLLCDLTALLQHNITVTLELLESSHAGSSILYR